MGFTMNIRLAIMLALTLPAHTWSDSNKPQERDWQDGTVQSAQIKHTGHFHPMMPEVSLEILSSTNVLYRVTIAPGIHKKDLVPGVGLVTTERRRSKMRTIDIPVGSKVKFAVSGYHGWLIDSEGVEREILIKNAKKAAPSTPNAAPPTH